MTPTAIIDAAKHAAERYAELVTMLRRGERRPEVEIDRVLSLANRTHADLVHAVLSGERGLIPGDTCDCGGRISVANSKHKGTRQVRYLKCSACGRSAGKQLLPRSIVRKRSTSI